jgi:hypothetical protein
LVEPVVLSLEDFSEESALVLLSEVLPVDESVVVAAEGAPDSSVFLHADKLKLASVRRARSKHEGNNRPSFCCTRHLIPIVAISSIVLYFRQRYRGK